MQGSSANVRCQQGNTAEHEKLRTQWGRSGFWARTAMAQSRLHGAWHVLFTLLYAIQSSGVSHAVLRRNCPDH